MFHPGTRNESLSNHPFPNQNSPHSSSRYSNTSFSQKSPLVLSISTIFYSTCSPVAVSVSTRASSCSVMHRLHIHSVKSQGILLCSGIQHRLQAKIHQVAGPGSLPWRCMLCVFAHTGSSRWYLLKPHSLLYLSQTQATVGTQSLTGLKDTEFD